MGGGGWTLEELCETVRYQVLFVQGSEQFENFDVGLGVPAANVAVHVGRGIVFLVAPRASVALGLAALVPNHVPHSPEACVALFADVATDFRPAAPLDLGVIF